MNIIQKLEENQFQENVYVPVKKHRRWKLICLVFTGCTIVAVLYTEIISVKRGKGLFLDSIDSNL